VTVYRRTEQGVYLMQFEQNGIHIHRSTGAYTEKEALRVQERLRAKMRRKFEKALPEPPIVELKPPTTGPVQMNLEEACARCFRERWKDTKSSVFTYRRAVYMAEIIGKDLPLREIDERHIRYLVDVLTADGAAAGTINRYLASLKTILYMAVREWHALDRMPAIRMKREPPGRIRIITRDEEAEMLELLSKSSLYRAKDVAALICVLVDTGMRHGEALAMVTKDVNFETRQISIWFNKADRPRSVPMTQRVIEILRSRTQEGQKYFPFNETSTHKVWKWLRREMGMENDKQFVLHALRHTCASRMVEAGVEIYAVKGILGHSTVKTTERYAHLSPSRLRAAIDTLEIKQPPPHQPVPPSPEEPE